MAASATRIFENAKVRKVDERLPAAQAAELCMREESRPVSPVFEGWGGL